MARSTERRGGMLGKLRGRRERRPREAHAQGEEREWERSGEVGRHGTHEGYTSGSF